MSKSWANGSDYNWRKRVRPFVLARDQYICKLNLPEVCTTRATQVHHTLGRAVTGDDPAYLIATCRACNLKVGDPAKHKSKPSNLQSHWK